VSIGLKRRENLHERSVQEVLSLRYHLIHRWEPAPCPPQQKTECLFYRKKYPEKLYLRKNRITEGESSVLTKGVE
jgi:hypothetical protein